MEAMIWDLLLVFGYALQSIGLFFVPKEWRGKKILEDDVILITGGGSGIGREFALNFAKRGARKVVLFDVNEAGMTETAELVKKQFTSCTVTNYVVDVTKRSQVYVTAEKIKNEVGIVSYLLNNAGIVSGSPILTTPDEKIVKTFEVNAISHFWTLKAFLPAMIERNRGHIVTTASLAGHIGLARLVDYVSSKHAAVGTHRALRSELLVSGSDGINMTCICPFYIDTGMFAGVKTGSVFSFLKPQHVVEESMRSILVNQEMVYLPSIYGLLLAMAAVFPAQSSDALIRFFGVATSMNTFVGRETARKKV